MGGHGTGAEQGAVEPPVKSRDLPDAFDPPPEPEKWRAPPSATVLALEQQLVDQHAQHENLRERSFKLQGQVRRHAESSRIRPQVADRGGLQQMRGMYTELSREAEDAKNLTHALRMKLKKQRLAEEVAWAKVEAGEGPSGPVKSDAPTAAMLGSEVGADIYRVTGKRPKTGGQHLEAPVQVITWEKLHDVWEEEGVAPARPGGLPPPGKAKNNSSGGAASSSLSIAAPAAPAPPSEGVSAAAPSPQQPPGFRRSEKTEDFSQSQPHPGFRHSETTEDFSQQQPPGFRRSENTTDFSQERSLAKVQQKPGRRFGARSDSQEDFSRAVHTEGQERSLAVCAQIADGTHASRSLEEQSQTARALAASSEFAAQAARGLQDEAMLTNFGARGSQGIP